MLMVHCPNCGKEVGKPSRVLTNQSFTIQAYNCGKCHHYFKVTINHSMYNNLEIYVPKIIAQSNSNNSSTIQADSVIE